MGVVLMRYTKYDGRLHWHFEVEELGEDEHGHWFSGRPGLSLQRGDEPPIHEVDGFAMLVPHRGDWIAFWNRLDEPAVYVDVTDTPRIHSRQVDAIDLDLDVVAWRDGRVEIVDADEFEEHRHALAYPAELVAGARQAADWVEGALRAAVPPFDSSGWAWLDRAALAWPREGSRAPST